MGRNNGGGGGGGGTSESRAREEGDATRRVMTRVMHERMRDAGAGAGAGAGDATPLDPDEIMRIVEEMQGDPRDSRSRAAAYGRKYPGFMEQCPALFQKACRPGIDVNMLRFMVEASKGHDEEESASAVGARLAERFVRPRVSRADAEE